MCRTAWRFYSYILIVAIVLNAQTSHAQLQVNEVTPEKVQQAIDQAKSYLLKNQLGDGGWAGKTEWDGGATFIIILALLNAGVPPDNPKLAHALIYAKQQQPDQTYAVSLQTMAFCAADPNRFAAEIQRNTQWLVSAQSSSGGWSYGQRGGAGDPSNSQFALLALHEAQRAGAQVPAAEWQLVFERAQEYWLKYSKAKGGFSYNLDGANGGASGSMTCAGIASLIITGSQLQDAEATADPRIRCCGQADNSRASQAIEDGLNWLGANFSVSTNPNSGPVWYLYYIYGLERAGRMTGQRFIGKHDWYREGARELLNLQNQKGTGSIFTGSSNANEPVETALALLFLAKGKRQIVVSRLQFDKTDDWNHHRTAIHNLTSHTEQAWKRDLAWQTIDLNKAQLQDLLETPVLFLSGTQLPKISNQQKLMLRDYVMQGGFIFAEACNEDGCQGEAFDQFMRQFASDVLGKPLEKLSVDHPIWRAEKEANINALPENFWLYGVQSCCRLGLVYSPISLSCRWHLNQPFGIAREFPPKVKEELDAATLVGVNVLSYATGKELKQKLQSVIVLDEVRNDAPTDRGVFILPKLQHSAGADDASRAVPNLIEWLNKENPFRMSSEQRMIAVSASELEKYPIVFIHGRGELRFTEEQRTALREYLKNGGFLFADAICADDLFTASFRREMEVITGRPLQKLPLDHDIVEGNRGIRGFDIRQVTVIDPQKGDNQLANSQRRQPPRLEFASVDERIAVVFSPLDLSCALESRHSLQCRGYVRDDAAKIGINVLLYALQQ